MAHMDNAHMVNRKVDYIVQESIATYGVTRKQTTILGEYDSVNADDRVSIISTDKGIYSLFNQLYDSDTTAKILASAVYGNVFADAFDKFNVVYDIDYTIKHALAYVSSIDDISSRKSMADWTIDYVPTINAKRYAFGVNDWPYNNYYVFSIIGSYDAIRDTFSKYGKNVKTVAKVIRVETYDPNNFTYSFNDYVIETDSNGHVKSISFDFAKLFHNFYAPMITENAHDSTTKFGARVREYKLYLTETKRTEVGTYRKIL